MRRFHASFALTCPWVSTSLAQAQPTLMLRRPAVSRDHLAFIHAGDIWPAPVAATLGCWP